MQKAHIDESNRKIPMRATLSALILLLIASTTLTGCSSRSNATDYEEVCIDGVSYLTLEAGYGGYMSAKFDKNSKVVLCDQ